MSIDYSTHDSREAEALIVAFKGLPCDAIHFIWQKECPRCMSTLHDALASALCVLRVQAEVHAFNEAAEILHAASTEQVKSGDDNGAIALAAGAALMESKAEMAQRVTRRVTP